MSHDPALLRSLSAFQMEPFSGLVYRYTSMSRDPTEASANGGRWGLPQNQSAGTPVLYTSLDPDGAISEVTAYLLELSPLPKSRVMKLSKLEVSASKVVTLGYSELTKLGLDLKRYGSRDYFLTQQIGSALEHLGADGLIAPSARHDCNNLMIFATQHAFSETLHKVEEKEVEWRDWARQRGKLAGLE